jgi:hypothetical protein
MHSLTQTLVTLMGTMTTPIKQTHSLQREIPCSSLRVCLSSSGVSAMEYMLSTCMAKMVFPHMPIPAGPSSCLPELSVALALSFYPRTAGTASQAPIQASAPAHVSAT